MNEMNNLIVEFRNRNCVATCFLLYNLLMFVNISTYLYDLVGNTLSNELFLYKATNSTMDNEIFRYIEISHINGYFITCLSSLIQYFIVIFLFIISIKSTNDKNYNTSLI